MKTCNLPSMPVGNSGGASIVLPITLWVTIHTYFSPVSPIWPAVFKMERASSRVEYRRTMRASESTKSPRLLALLLTSIVFRILNLHEK